MKAIQKRTIRGWSYVITGVVITFVLVFVSDWFFEKFFNISLHSSLNNISSEENIFNFKNFIEIISVLLYWIILIFGISSREKIVNNFFPINPVK